MILNVDRTERMAYCDTPVVCIFMVLARMNTRAKLSRVINLGRWLSSVPLFGSSLGSDHLN